MEEVTTQSSPPAADDAAVAAQPAVEESGERDRSPAAEGPKSAMDAFVRGIAGRAPTSKPTDGEPSGESTPAGDVKPGETRERDQSGRFIPRRGIPEAIKTAEDEIADLRRQLADRDPEKLRQQWLDEQAARAAGPDDEEQARIDTARFLELRDLPDDHPKLAEGDNYAWLQDQKALRANYPKAERALRAQYEAHAQAVIQGRDQAVLGALKRHVGLPGVDEATFRRLSDWGDLGDHLYEAGQRSRDAEVAALKDRNAELERDQQQARYAGPRGLGSARAPIPAGRAASGAARDMDSWIRGRF